MTFHEEPGSSEIVIRGFKEGDEASFLGILKENFGGLELLPRIRLGLSSSYFNREGSFVAEKNGVPVGCIGLINLPRSGWFELRWLGVMPGQPKTVAKVLVDRGVDYAESKHSERLKAFTPAVQPNVDIYEDKGFKPERRQLRMSWDLSKDYGHYEGSIDIEKLTVDRATEASRVWVEGLSPYWDWWIEEQGGPVEAGSWIEESVKKGDHWMGAFIDGRLAGTTLVWPDFYGAGDARFNGVYVLPDMRNKGVGWALMHSAIKMARELGQMRMNVNTVAFIDHLAPGAILYLKSGGRVEAEYLELCK